eukprot:jgi/Tetstr1/426009/TSEL_016356.t1
MPFGEPEVPVLEKRYTELRHEVDRALDNIHPGHEWPLMGELISKVMAAERALQTASKLSSPAFSSMMASGGAGKPQSKALQKDSSHEALIKSMQARMKTRPQAAAAQAPVDKDPDIVVESSEEEEEEEEEEDGGDGDVDMAEAEAEAGPAEAEAQPAQSPTASPARTFAPPSQPMFSPTLRRLEAEARAAEAAEVVGDSEEEDYGFPLSLTQPSARAVRTHV